MNKNLASLIMEAVKDVGEEQDVEIPTSLDDETKLFGQQGLFDSLGLVSLVVAVEQAIADKFGSNISLADEKAMSQKHSPYRSIGSLADYASRLLEENL